MSRSYIVKRREKGQPDVATHFPEEVPALGYALEWCKSEGYKVIGHECTKSPDDENFAGIIVVTVEPKPKTQTCPY